MNQGDIYLVNLEPTIHSEVGKTRPGMVLSVNVMNQHSPRLIIAPITSKIARIYPFEVFIPQGTAGLDKDSKIMLDQIRSLDKRRLRNKIGSVPYDMLLKASTVAQRLIFVE